MYNKLPSVETTGASRAVDRDGSGVRWETRQCKAPIVCASESQGQFSKGKRDVGCPSSWAGAMDVKFQKHDFATRPVSPPPCTTAKKISCGPCENF